MEEYLFRFLSIFLFCFELFIYLENHPLSVTLFANIFSQSIGCLFIFLILPLLCKSLCLTMSIAYFCFYFYCLNLKKTLLWIILNYWVKSAKVLWPQKAVKTTESQEWNIFCLGMTWSKESIAYKNENISWKNRKTLIQVGKVFQTWEGTFYQEKDLKI